MQQGRQQRLAGLNDAWTGLCSEGGGRWHRRSALELLHVSASLPAQCPGVTTQLKLVVTTYQHYQSARMSVLWCQKLIAALTCPAIKLGTCNMG